MYLSRLKGDLLTVTLFIITTALAIGLPAAMTKVSPRLAPRWALWVLEVLMLLALVTLALQLIISLQRWVVGVRMYWRVRRLLLDDISTIVFDEDLLLEFTQEPDPPMITVVETTRNAAYIEYNLTPWGEVYITWRIPGVTDRDAPTYVGNYMKDLLKRIPAT